MVRRKIKGAIRLIIESDGNLTTLIVRTSKVHILKALDLLLPDEVVEK